MGWFRVDDAFDDHPKVLHAGNASVGLWVRCGVYAARLLTDGFIPQQVARARGTQPEIRRLLGSGLWLPADGGYRMHDWEDYQQSREEIEERRAADRDRKRVNKSQEFRAESRRSPGGVRTDSGRSPHGFPVGLSNNYINPNPDSKRIPAGIQPERRPTPTPQPMAETLADLPERREDINRAGIARLRKALEEREQTA